VETKAVLADVVEELPWVFRERALMGTFSPTVIAPL